jgi:hypothetical protein
MFQPMVFFCSVFFAWGKLLAQADNAALLQENFNRYQLAVVQEKLFVHTDKSFYLPGEMIWFKLYCVDAALHIPINLSKVAYVEILNNEQKPVLQAGIALEEGKGEGSFIIPSSLMSGNYLLRAYTKRMRNFNPSCYFETVLTIANTLKEPPVKPADIKQHYQLAFFPEGGNLVNGLPSTVAFTVKNQYGDGIAGRGYLTSNRQDTIARLETLQFGMGSFSFLPSPGVSYQAVFTINDTTVVQSLPAAYEQGYTLHCSESVNKDALTVTVDASERFTNRQVFLFVHTRHLVQQVLAGRIETGKATFHLNKNQLGEGVSHLTVFDESRRPVCERLYFKRPSNRLRLKVITDKDRYSPREKVNIALQTSNENGNPVATDMSMAVFLVDSLQPLQYDDIQSWLLLQSELQGRIAFPQSYLNDSSATGEVSLNNLLLTQGWRRFNWEDVNTGRIPLFEFITEHEGPVITAVVTDKKTGLPKKNTLATLTIPGEHFELRSAMSRNNGSIHFNVNNFYGSNELIVQAADAADSTVKINFSSPFSDAFSSTVLPRFYIPGQWQGQLTSRSIGMQAENAYLVEQKKRTFGSDATDTTAFYGRADKQYFLDDYTRFTTMDEVMNEFVLNVRVRKQPAGYEFRVVNTAFKAFFEQPPLVLIDGLPANNLDKIMALDPLKIKNIDIATHRHYLGPLAIDGLVSFKSYEGDLAGYELDPNAVVLAYEGLQRQRIFYAPVYETSQQKESRIPDLRNLLHWAPALETGENGSQQRSFYTGDFKGNYVVVVQGITAGGLAGSNITRFTVGE